MKFDNGLGSRLAYNGRWVQDENGIEQWRSDTRDGILPACKFSDHIFVTRTVESVDAKTITYIPDLYDVRHRNGFRIVGRLKHNRARQVAKEFVAKWPEFEDPRLDTYDPYSAGGGAEQSAETRQFLDKILVQLIECGIRKSRWE